MKEQQLIINNFLNFRLRFSNRRIMIYGVELNTKYIVEHIGNKKTIIGLIDAQQAGKYLYGYRVYAVDEVVGVADVIVIVARVAIIHMLYERVKHLESHGIEIYNLDGNNLREHFTKQQTKYENNPYWEQSEVESLIRYE